MVVLITDINAVGKRPRAQQLVKAAIEHNAVMARHKKKLQAAVTKASASRSDIDSLISTSDDLIDESKGIHAELKPHVKAVAAEFAADQAA